MNKLNIDFDKNKKVFNVSINSSKALFTIKEIPVKSQTIAMHTYHFMLILRVLSRCGFVKPLKRI